MTSYAEVQTIGFMRIRSVLTMLFASVCAVFADPTNSSTNTPPVVFWTNVNQSIGSKTDTDHTPQIQVGPFTIQGGQEKKAESDNVWISILKVVIWPVLIACFGFYFGEDIRSFAKKIKSVKAKDYGVEMGTDERLAEQQNAATAKGVSPLSTAQPSGAGHAEFEKAKAAVKVTAAMEPIIAEVRKSIETNHFTPEQNIELGITAIARVALWAEFWKIYSFIFGSQLQLLQTINTRPVPQTEVDAFFANVKQQFLKTYESWNSHAYLEFLLNSGLVVKQGEQYIITPKGREFLVFCIENNLAMNKGL